MLTHFVPHCGGPFAGNITVRSSGSGSGSGSRAKVANKLGKANEHPGQAGLSIDEIEAKLMQGWIEALADRRVLRVLEVLGSPSHPRLEHHAARQDDHHRPISAAGLFCPRCTAGEWCPFHQALDGERRNECSPQCFLLGHYKADRQSVSHDSYEDDDISTDVGGSEPPCGGGSDVSDCEGSRCQPQAQTERRKGRWRRPGVAVASASKTASALCDFRGRSWDANTKMGRGSTGLMKADEQRSNSRATTMSATATA